MTKKLTPLLLLVLTLTIALVSGCAGLSGDADRYEPPTGKSVTSPRRPSTPLPSPTLKLRLPRAATTSASGRASKPDPKSHNAATAYTLRPNDPVMITLRSIPKPEEIEEIVDEEGYVNLPYIGRVEAAGLTSSELEQSIQRSYIDGDFYRQVTVTVVIAAQSYYVRGEVKKPGRYQIVSGVTLVRALAAAAGFTDFANPKKITLIRGGNNRVHNYWDMETDPEKDVGIEAGDVIVVPRGFL